MNFLGSLHYCDAFVWFGGQNFCQQSSVIFRHRSIRQWKMSRSSDGIAQPTIGWKCYSVNDWKCRQPKRRKTNNKVTWGCWRAMPEWRPGHQAIHVVPTVTNVWRSAAVITESSSHTLIGSLTSPQKWVPIFHLYSTAINNSNYL